MDRFTATATTLLGGATAALALMVGFALGDDPAAFTGSRDAVQEICKVNQGSYIDCRSQGTHDVNPGRRDYGCFTQSGWIWCEADGRCQGGQSARQGLPGIDRSRTAWPIPGAGPQGTSGQLTAWP